LQVLHGLKDFNIFNLVAGQVEDSEVGEDINIFNSLNSVVLEVEYVQVSEHV